MTSQGFIDLDELVLLCRDEKAKSFIEEAVQCYKSGAFRQAIVATWIAVVYDIIHKFQELDLTGDTNARKILEEYEKIRKAGDVRASLDFEKKILIVAKDDFGLISDIEHVDLSRLQEDRNRCAHPALNISDETYKPTPELARTHLRNAIEHLLQRPPVQGKAALERLEKEIQSEYFPTIPEDAVNYFKNGPLSRPRDSLVRNFAIIILKSLLLEEMDEQSERRYEAALQAIRIMQKEIVEATFQERLNDIVLRVADDQLFKCLRILSNISDTWQYLKDDSRKRLQNYVIALPDAMIGRKFVYVFSFPPFQDDEAFRSGVIDTVVSKYEDASSFYEANDIGIYMIVPSVKHLKAVHVSRIVHAAAHNRQIADSYQRDNVLNVVKGAEIVPSDEFDKLLAENGLTL